MNSNYLLAIAILLAAGGQILMKLGVMRLGPLEIPGNIVSMATRMILNPGILAGLFVYGVSAFLWVIVLSKVELSYAYPMIAGGYVVVALLSWIIFHDQITPMRIAALVIIVMGVILLGRS